MTAKVLAEGVIKGLWVWLLLIVILLAWYIGEGKGGLGYFLESARIGVGQWVLKIAEALVSAAERIMDWTEEAFDL